MRPIAEGESVIVHPADARVSQFGPITDGRLIQAKGHDFSARELLGGDANLAEKSSKTVNLQHYTYHQAITTAFTCHVTALYAR